MKSIAEWSKVSAAMLSMALITASLQAAAQFAPPSPEVLLKRGAATYAQTCTGYCHGNNGVAGGGAPQLAGRGFDLPYIAKVVTYGVPGTAMAPMGQRLPQADLNAVIAFVGNLNGIAPSGGRAAPATLSKEAEQGRDLFYDVSAEMDRCSNCHQVGGKGVFLAPIKSLPGSVSALRGLTLPVSAVTAGNDTFPGIVVMQGRTEMRVLDLSSRLPVLRIFDPSEVKLGKGGTWKHASIQGKSYSDGDLSAIIAFLKAGDGGPSPGAEMRPAAAVPPPAHPE